MPYQWRTLYRSERSEVTSKWADTAINLYGTAFFDAYFQHMRNAVPEGWLRICTTDDIGIYHSILRCSFSFYIMQIFGVYEIDVLLQ